MTMTRSHAGFDLDSEDGVLAFAAYKFNSQTTANKRIGKSREEVLGGKKLFGVQQDEECSTLQGQCKGSGGEVYAVSAAVQGEGPHQDPARVQCGCMAAQKEPLCKHGLALLLWRLLPPNKQAEFMAAAPSQASGGQPSAHGPSHAVPASAPAPSLPPPPASPGPAQQSPSAAAAAGTAALVQHPAASRKLPAWMVKGKAAEGTAPGTGSDRGGAAGPSMAGRTKRARGSEGERQRSTRRGTTERLSSQQMLALPDQSLLQDARRILAQRPQNAPAAMPKDLPPSPPEGTRDSLRAREQDSQAGGGSQSRSPPVGLGAAVRRMPGEQDVLGGKILAEGDPQVPAAAVGAEKLSPGQQADQGITAEGSGGPGGGGGGGGADPPAHGGAGEVPSPGVAAPPPSPSLFEAAFGWASAHQAPPAAQADGKGAGEPAHTSLLGSGGERAGEGCVQGSAGATAVGCAGGGADVRRTIPGGTVLQEVPAPVGGPGGQVNAGCAERDGGRAGGVGARCELGLTHSTGKRSEGLPLQGGNAQCGPPLLAVREEGGTGGDGVGEDAAMQDSGARAVAASRQEGVGAKVKEVPRLSLRAKMAMRKK